MTPKEGNLLLFSYSLLRSEEGEMVSLHEHLIKKERGDTSTRIRAWKGNQISLFNVIGPSPHHFIFISTCRESMPCVLCNIGAAAHVLYSRRARVFLSIPERRRRRPFGCHPCTQTHFFLFKRNLIESNDEASEKKMKEGTGNKLRLVIKAPSSPAQEKKKKLTFCASKLLRLSAFSQSRPTISGDDHFELF